MSTRKGRSDRSRVVAPRQDLYGREEDFQQAVLDLARIHGWRRFHARLSIGSAHGYPDLTLIRPPRLILAELKTDNPRSVATVAQQEWLDDVAACPGVEGYLWRPRQWGEIHAALKR